MIGILSVRKGCQIEMLQGGLGRSLWLGVQKFAGSLVYGKRNSSAFGARAMPYKTLIFLFIAFILTNTAKNIDFITIFNYIPKGNCQVFLH